MYKCKHGCGYGHEQRGTMNLHESKHCKMKEAEVKPVKSDSDCDCSDGGSWRMLTGQEKQISSAAYPEKNYKEVCDSCQELR